MAHIKHVFVHPLTDRQNGDTQGGVCRVKSNWFVDGQTLIISTGVGSMYINVTTFNKHLIHRSLVDKCIDDMIQNKMAKGLMQVFAC